jgi:hypothetical protein
MNESHRYLPSNPYLNYRSRIGVLDVDDFFINNDRAGRGKSGDDLGGDRLLSEARSAESLLHGRVLPKRVENRRLLFRRAVKVHVRLR